MLAKIKALANCAVARHPNEVVRSSESGATFLSMILGANGLQAVLPLMDAIDGGVKQQYLVPDVAAEPAVPQPELESSDLRDQRHDRMRQLAIVFIEMFRERKRTASEEAA